MTDLSRRDLIVGAAAVAASAALPAAVPEFPAVSQIVACTERVAVPDVVVYWKWLATFKPEIDGWVLSKIEEEQPDA